MVSNGETQAKMKRGRQRTDTLATGKRTGRPSGYTDAIARSICHYIAQGKSLVTICKRKGAPSYSMITRWLADNTEFRVMYARARESAGDAAYEKIVEIERRLEAKEIDAHTARVLIDSIKWRASKLKPRVYGDHQQVLIGGGLEVATRNLVDGAPDWIKERIAKTTSAGPSAEVAAGIAAGIAASRPKAS